LTLVQLFLAEHEVTEIDPRNARYVNDNLPGDSIPVNGHAGESQSGSVAKST
jgi:hypothetical protein